MRIYTKTGDKGTTSLVGGTRVSKADLRLEAYGTADELNSFIGLLRAKGLDAAADDVLKRVQNKLFNLGGFLATEAEPVVPADNGEEKSADNGEEKSAGDGEKSCDGGEELPNEGKRVRKTYPSTEIAVEEVKMLEAEIDKMQEDLPVVRGFILPAGDEVVSLCHVCRTVCRRLERRMVALFESEGGGDEKAEICLQYVNRLSDYLFILSKKEAKIRENALFLWEK